MCLFFQVIFYISSSIKTRQTFLYVLYFFMIFWSSDPLIHLSLCTSTLGMKYTASELHEMETQEFSVLRWENVLATLALRWIYY